MPNWCFNKIDITGAAEDLAAFHADRLAAIKNFAPDDDGREFTFNQFLPMPQELKYETQEFAAGTIPPDVQARRSTLKEKYGESNWYDWACVNWDTKWDAVRSSSDRQSISFETAWCAPTKVIVAMARMYPKLRFTHSFLLECEPGDWLHIYYTDDAGVLMVRRGFFLSEEEQPVDEMVAYDDE